MIYKVQLRDDHEYEQERRLTLVDEDAEYSMRRRIPLAPGHALFDACTTIMTVSLAAAARYFDVPDFMNYAALLPVGMRATMYVTALHTGNEHQRASETIEARLPVGVDISGLQLASDGEQGDLEYANISGDLTLANE